MCGIAGIIGTPKTSECLAILEHLQERGRDATGIGLNTGDMYRTFKVGMPAEDVCEMPKFQKQVTKYIGQASVALLHCRQATHGSPSDNRNNHPIWNNKGVIVHNGIVHVDHKYKKAQGETDTEQMLHHITTKGITTAIKECYGSFAFAYQPFERPHLVYLYEHVSPLVFGRKNGNVYFCSTAQILHAAIGSFKEIRPKYHHLYRIDARTGKIHNCGVIHPKSSWYVPPRTGRAEQQRLPGYGSMNDYSGRLDNAGRWYEDQDDPLLWYPGQGKGETFEDLAELGFHEEEL